MCTKQKIGAATYILIVVCMSRINDSMLNAFTKNHTERVNPLTTIEWAILKFDDVKMTFHKIKDTISFISFQSFLSLSLSLCTPPIHNTTPPFRSHPLSRINQLDRSSPVRALCHARSDRRHAPYNGGKKPENFFKINYLTLSMIVTQFATGKLCYYHGKSYPHDHNIKTFQ